MNQLKSVSVVGVIFLVSISCSLVSAGVTLEDVGRGFGFGQDCDGSYSLTCFKKDIVSYIEKMSHNDEVSIMPGMSIVKDEGANTTKTSQIVAEIARSFPNDPAQRLDGFLLAKLSNYLQSHTLKLKLFNGESLEKVESAFQGRKGKIGKKGGLEAILAAAMMMKGMMGALALGGLAMLAGKALMTGLMALMLSAIVGLKSLGGGQKQTTYEIVAKPLYSHTHSSSHEDHHGGHGGHGGTGYGGYGRSMNFELPEHLKTPQQ